MLLLSVFEEKSFVGVLALPWLPRGGPGGTFLLPWPWRVGPVTCQPSCLFRHEISTPPAIFVLSFRLGFCSGVSSAR